MDYKEEYEEALEKIIELEERLEEKDIVIDSLVCKILALRNGCTEKKKIDLQSVKRRRENHVEIKINKIKEPKDSSISEQEIEISDYEKEKSTQEIEITVENPMEIKILKNCPKKREMIFKSNYNFDEYANYTKSLILPYIFDDRRKIKPSKTVKNYVEINLKGILRYIGQQINSADIEQIYTLLLITSLYSSYEVKILIFHDVLLFLDDCSKILFFANAIFYECDLQYDIISTTVKKILNYQLAIDSKLYKEFRLYYNKIESNLSLAPSSTDFISYVISLENNCNVENEDSIENITAIIRMVTMFMDYNWSYNDLVVDTIYPRYILDKKPFYLIVIGTVALQGQRMFPEDKSVQLLYNFLKKENREHNKYIKTLSLLFISRFENIEITDGTNILF